MKRLLLGAILYLTLPLPALAANIDLTFSTAGKVDTAEVVLGFNDNVTLFYEEARNYEAGTIETVQGVTFSFSFDLKKEESR